MKFVCQHPCTEKLHHVFFVAVLPDLMKVIRGENYEEVIFDETPQQVLNRLKDMILLADKKYAQSTTPKYVSPSSAQAA